MAYFFHVTGMILMYKLPKSGILRKNKNFQALYRHGRSFANKLLVLYILPNRSSGRRVGFAAGKKLGNAVVRNRVKRLLREAYRHNQQNVLPGYDLIIVGRKPVVELDFAAVSRALVQLFDRAGIMAE